MRFILYHKYIKNKQNFSFNFKSTFNLLNISNIIKIIDNTLPCKGNGKALGLTNGGLHGGLNADTYGIYTLSNAYNTNVSTNVMGNSDFAVGYTIGITDESAKSDIVVDLSSTSLNYNYVIKY